MTLTVLLLAAAGTAGAVELAHCAWLAAAPRVRLAWGANATHARLRLTTAAPEPGWLALGFSPDGSMDGAGLGADMVVYHPQRRAVADYLATAHSRPQLDEAQDWQLVDESVAGGKTTFEVVRALDTGDAAGDRVLALRGGTHALWAVGAAPAVDLQRFGRHELAMRAGVRVDWAGAPRDCPPLPPAPAAGDAAPAALPVDADTGSPPVVRGRFASADGTVRIEWKPDVSADGRERRVVFDVEMHTEGWIALGLAQHASMLGADVALAWVAPDGASVLLDMHNRADARVAPLLDSQNDLVLLELGQGGGRTTLRFSRSLRSHDRNHGDDHDIVDYELFLLFAYGAHDGEYDAATRAVRVAKHVRRGAARVNLLRSTAATAAGDDGVLVAHEVTELSDGARHSDVRAAHGMVMLLAFPLALAGAAFVAQVHAARVAHDAAGGSTAAKDRAVLLPVPFFSAPALLRLTRGLTAAGALLAATGFVLALVGHDTGALHFHRTHEVLGLVALLLGLVALPALHAAASRAGRIGVRVLAGAALALGLFNALLGFKLFHADVRLVELYIAQLVIVAVAVTLPLLCRGVDALTGRGAAGVAEATRARSVRLRGRDDNGDDDNDDNDESTDDAELETRLRTGVLAMAARRLPTLWRLMTLIVPTVMFVLFVLLARGLADAEQAGTAFAEHPVHEHCRDCSSTRMTMSQYRVPTGIHPANQATPETAYVCRAFDIGAELRHAVEFTPIIDKAEVVHHMILWSVPIDMRDRGVFPCINMPEGAFPLWVWVVGGGKQAFPPDVGMAVGEGTKYRYLALQMHYDDPLQSNAVDSSGVAIQTTPHLRPREASIVFFGPDLDDIEIPPQQHEWELSSECTLSQLPEPLDVFAVAQHAHRLGRTIWFEQWRDGMRIAWGPEPADFDFNRQIAVDSLLQFEPGDTIVTHCTYNSMSRLNTTSGGDGSNEEMCFILTWNAPAVDVIGCGSKVRVWDPTDGHFNPAKPETKDGFAGIYPPGFDADAADASDD